MKTFFLAITMASLTSFAHAEIAGKYTLVNGNGQLCSSNLDIEKVSDTTLQVSGTYDLGAYFNLDSTPGNLIISGINKGPQKENSSNRSHGQRYESVSNTVVKGNQLNLTKMITERTLFVTVSKTRNELNLTKSGKKLKVIIKRSYDETGSQSGDWTSSEECLYTE